MGSGGWRTAIIASLLLLPWCVSPATAQESAGPRSEAEVERIGARLDRELMSPFCQGLTLESCPTSSAAELRAEVRDWLRAGRSEEWIKETLVERYGEGVLGAPRFRGIGILAWVLPGIALLAAAVGVGLWMRGHVGGGPADERPAAADDEGRRAATARVERDLQRLEEEP